MMKRYGLLAAAALLASACASTPAAGPNPGETPAPAAPAAPAASSVLENMAATTHWAADERLLPQDPILALVRTGGSVNAPAGLSMTCNPDNGRITARLGKQPASKAGQEATFTLRLGAAAEKLEGRFVASPRTGDADFVFPLESVTLRTMAQLDSVSFVTDAGEVQWTLVRDPNAAITNAKYVASLKDLNAASQSYLVFCNPK